jgi:hypothetical protein
MMEVIVYELDGELCRVTPAPSFSVDDIKKDIPQGVSYEIVENDSLPESKYRNAWKLENKEVVICPIKKQKCDADIETIWIDEEIESLKEKIEAVEDTGKTATKLRAYRVALKQYKSDLYMPNVTRPVL